jgi:hypothetical protein
MTVYYVEDKNTGEIFESRRDVLITDISQYHNVHPQIAAAMLDATDDIHCVTLPSNHRCWRESQELDHNDAD